jgi:hypothetical protein
MKNLLLPVDKPDNPLSDQQLSLSLSLKKIKKSSFPLPANNIGVVSTQTH